ncbi:MAG: hypothetical protein FD131_4608 [Rhodocyclaceae bacterium]|nr:MAG: hypothetical protein FD131_4608 [Rhodocyclaceae bacterium]
MSANDGAERGFPFMPVRTAEATPVSDSDKEVGRSILEGQARSKARGRQIPYVRNGVFTGFCPDERVIDLAAFGTPVLRAFEIGQGAGPLMPFWAQEDHLLVGAFELTDQGKALGLDQFANFRLRYRFSGQTLRTPATLVDVLRGAG